MNRQLLLSLVIIVVVVCAGAIVLISIASAPSPEPTHVSVSDDMVQMSEEFYQSIDVITDEIADAMHDVAEELSTCTPDDPEAKEILRDLFDKYPNSAGIAWVSADNTIISVPVYSMDHVLTSRGFTDITEKSFTGRDVILTDPVMSNVYGMVVCFIVPVYAADGSYNGYLCFAHLPITLLNETPDTPYYKDTKYELWIANSDGTVFCHPDLSTIGYNYYTNAFYRGPGKSFSGIRAIIENNEGTTSYEFYDLSNTDVVEKVSIWKTLSFGGQDLRLVLLNYPYKVPEVSLPDTVNLAEITDVTQALYLYAKKYGKGATLAAMNDPSGPFSNTGTKIFAISTDGVVLSMPSKDKIVGLNRINYQDAYGIRQVATMINRVSQGGGYVHYYSDPLSSKNQTILGLAYVLPVDETWFVGSEKSVLNHTVSFNPDMRSKLVRAVQPLQEYVNVHGKEQTLAALNDPSGELINPDISFVAISYDGKLLADASKPDMIGDDVFSLVGPHGTSITRDLVLIAKQGGGFEYVETRDADNFMLSLTYVESVDDEWFIAGSIELSSHPIVLS
ncbi:cache domain-containing protein [Methanorbis rubei]